MSFCGKEHTEKTRKILSEKKKGKNNPMKRLEVVRKMVETKKRLYKEGKIVPWNLGRKGELSHSFGKKHTDETKKKMSKTQKRLLLNPKNNHWLGKKHSEETKRKIAEAHKRENLTEEYRKELSRINKRRYPNGPMYGKKHTKETRLGMSKFLKKQWLEEEFARKMCLSQARKPNKLEKRLAYMIEQNNLPFKYVGDGQFFLGGKNPDFLNTNGAKQLIELNGNYWHKRSDEQKRIDFFKKYGFETLVIWEDEFREEEKVIEKIEMFSRGFLP